MTRVDDALHSIEETDPIEKGIEPTGCDAIGPVMLISMMERMALRGQDEAQAMQPADESWGRRGMGPAMKLIRHEERESRTRAQHDQKLGQRSGRSTVGRDEDDDRKRDERVISRNFEEIVTRDFQGVFVVLAEWRDQHRAEQRSLRIEKAIRNPMYGAGEEIRQ